MKRILMFSILLGVILSACAGAEAPSTTEAAPIEAGVETSSPGDPNATYKLVPQESSLQYEVGETFINQNNKFSTAVGVTTEVIGDIAVNEENPQLSVINPIVAMVVQFKSDSAKRDEAIQNRFLESAKYPMVVFKPAEIIGLPESYKEGREISFQVVGDATIRETTLPLTFDVTAKLEDDTLTGEATSTFLMSDFGFGPISVAGILKTEDEVKLTFNFVARR